MKLIAFNMTMLLLKEFVQFQYIRFVANERIDAWNFQVFYASCNFTSYCSTMSMKNLEIFCQFPGSMAYNQQADKQHDGREYFLVHKLQTQQAPTRLHETKEGIRKVACVKHAKCRGVSLEQNRHFILQQMYRKCIQVTCKSIDCTHHMATRMYLEFLKSYSNLKGV